MKTNEAFNLNFFLKSIAKDCKGKLGYAVARNIRLLDTELTEFNNQRNELIKKYGIEKDNQVMIENGSYGHFKFLEEMKEYEDIDINIELMKVNNETLENSNLSADAMLCLMEFMLEGE